MVSPLARARFLPEFKYLPAGSLLAPLVAPRLRKAELCGGKQIEDLLPGRGGFEPPVDGCLRSAVRRVSRVWLTLKARRFKPN